MRKALIKSSPALKVKPGAAGKPKRDAYSPGRTEYVLRLYVSGSTLKSARAVENIKRVCEQHLKDRYDLEVIDVYQQADLASSERIVTVPTLIIRAPLPQRRLRGDLSDRENVLAGLELKERDD